MDEKHSEHRRAPDLEEVSSLFSLIGRAIWYVQHLENSLSNSIAIKRDLKDAALGSVSAEDTQRILAKRRRMTLGQAIGLAKDQSIYDGHLQVNLDKFLDERNWLVHRLVHENGEHMNINGKRDNFFQRIALISDEAQKLQKMIGSDLEDFVVSKGARREEIHARAERDFLRSRGLA